MLFEIKKRVIFADTDSTNIVYHSKYLDFCEEARMEFLLNNGLNQNKLINDYNVIFIVRSLEVNYIKPAKLEDLLCISIENIILKRLNIEFYQNIYRDNDVLVKCKISVVAVDNLLKPIRRLPNNIMNIFLVN